MNAPSFRTCNFVHDKPLKRRDAGKCTECTNSVQSASGETHRESNGRGAVCQNVGASPSSPWHQPRHPAWDIGPKDLIIIPNFRWSVGSSYSTTNRWHASHTTPLYQDRRPSPNNSACPKMTLTTATYIGFRM